MSASVVVSPHDYVIVGAGPAGCVLAHRLSADPQVSVLLLEAGEHDGGLWSRVPLGVGRILNDESRTWPLTTEPVPHAGGVAREWVSGRCLGGSSAVNGLVVVRGDPRCYDDWAAQGCPGWAHEDCLPYFRRLEHWQGTPSARRGQGGPIAVTHALTDPISDRFLAACQALGYRANADYNADFRAGASYLQLNTRQGLRSDAATGYLAPVRTRRNLTVLCGARAERVVIENGRARAVVTNVDGMLQELVARREVLLCCGAVRSPQLLELSGIGQPEVLEAQGLKVALANAHVGEHLQDHLMARLCFSTTHTETINAMMQSPARLAKQVLRFALQRQGLFASASLKSTLFAASGARGEAPDLRIQVALVSATNRIPKSIREGLDPGSAFQIGVYGLYPRAQGQVHIRSVSAQDAPRVQPNYLGDAADEQVLLQGLRIARRLSQTAPLKDVVQTEIRPGPAVDDDQAWLDYARRTGQTCWHPVSSCRMGTPDQAVVDARCRVHGVAGLRVVDASVFPLMPASNTHIPTLMLAERAADLIRDDNASGAAPTR